MKSFFRFPMQIITICFSLGIIIEHVYHPSIPYWAYILLLIVLSFLFIHLTKKQNKVKIILFGILAGLFFVNFGIFIKHKSSFKNNSHHFSKNILVNEKNLVAGCILSVEKASHKFNKYLVEIGQVGTQKTEGKLFLYLSKKDTLHLFPGDNVILNSKFYRSVSTPNPHGFDYNAFLENKNISQTVYCYEHEVLKIGSQKTIGKNLSHFKENVKAQFDSTVLSKQTKSIINALLFGEKSFIDKDLLNDYSKVGIIHILAISGLHIAILYFFIGFVLQPINKIKHGKLINYILTLFLLWGFALLTGFSPSVTRAVTMFSLFGLAKALKKDSNTYNVLFVSAFIILLFQPNYLFDVGFQLSYAAVFSIVAFQSYFSYFYFTKNKVITYFVDILLVSFAAQVGVLPISLYYFHQFPLLFFIANLFVIPLVSIVLVLSIINCFSFFVPKILSEVICYLIEFFASLMSYGIQFLSKLKNISIENIAFNENQLLLSFLFLLSLLYWLQHKKRKNYFLVLASSFLLFLSWLHAYKNENSSSELIVFNSKELLIGIKEKEQITFLTDSLSPANKTIITDYIRGNFNNCHRIIPINNLITVCGKQVKIVSNTIVLPTKNPTSILILDGNPKVNLEAVLLEEQPQHVLFTANNSKTTMALWQKTCIQQKIPFHAIAEKGFYKLLLK